MATRTSIGVQELEENPSKFLRLVREEHAAFDTTDRGEVVAHVIPARRDVDQAEIDAILARRRELTEKVRGVWPKGFSAADAVREQRRDL